MLVCSPENDNYDCFCAKKKHYKWTSGGKTQYCCSLPFDLIVLIFLVFSQFWLEGDVTLNWHYF